MDQDATWYGGRLRRRRHCVKWGPSSPLKKGAQQPQTFWLMSVVAKGLWPNGWIDRIPLGTGVGLGPGDIVSHRYHAIACTMLCTAYASFSQNLSLNLNQPSHALRFIPQQSLKEFPVFKRCYIYSSTPKAYANWRHHGVHRFSLR